MTVIRIPLFAFNFIGFPKFTRFRFWIPSICGATTFLPTVVYPNLFSTPTSKVNALSEVLNNTVIMLSPFMYDVHKTAALSTLTGFLGSQKPRSLADEISKSRKTFCMSFVANEVVNSFR